MYKKNLTPLDVGKVGEVPKNNGDKHQISII